MEPGHENQNAMAVEQDNRQHYVIKSFFIFLDSIESLIIKFGGMFDRILCL